MAGKMVRCPDGHFYDSAKHASCPWCAPAGANDPDAAAGPARTKPLPDLAGKPLPDVPPPIPSPSPFPAPPRPASPTVPLQPPRPEVSGTKTRPLDMAAHGTRPVVGWAVCIDGPDKGKDFRLHPEKNFIGRDAAMDVSLASDASVSRSRHAIIVFDPKKRNFWLYPGESQGLVYLKDELVNSPALVQPYDVMEVGASKLVLVPFDTERYSLQ